MRFGRVWTRVFVGFWIFSSLCANSFAFRYRIAPLTSPDCNTQICYTARFCAFAVAVHSSCQQFREFSEVCQYSPIQNEWVTPASGAVFLSLVAASQTFAYAIAPDFCGTLTTQLSSAVSQRALSWEEAKKLRYIEGEFKTWLFTPIHYLQAVKDEVHPGELEAIVDLERFREGYWSYADLSPFLILHGVTEEVWDQYRDEIDDLLRSGGVFYERAKAYIFLQIVRTAQEELDDLVHPANQGAGFDQSFTRVQDVLRVIRNEYYRDPFDVRIEVQAGARAEEQEGVRGGEQELPEEGALMHELVQDLLDREPYEDWINEEVDFVGREIQRAPGNSLVQPRQSFEGFLELKGPEKNLLRCYPFLRELYIHGPGSEVMGIQDFRSLIINNPELLDKKVIEFFKKEVHLSALQLMSSFDEKESYILKEFTRLGYGE